MSDPLRAGVHGLLGDPADLADALTAAGWRVAPVPAALTRGELYDAFAGALDLPGWFGRNLDALWDCLTDLDAPTALVLHGWTAYADARPEHAAALLDLLRERAAVTPAFLAVLAD